jgi:hypothetical protein
MSGEDLERIGPEAAKRPFTAEASLSSGVIAREFAASAAQAIDAVTEAGQPRPPGRRRSGPVGWGCNDRPAAWIPLRITEQ